MLPAEIDNYLEEVRRVLKAGGRCFATFFLLNAASLESLRSGRSTIDFEYVFDGYRVKDADTPEEAIAYVETYIHRLYAKHDLSIQEPVRYGSWSGRKDGLDYQDIIVARKPEKIVG